MIDITCDPSPWKLGAPQHTWYMLVIRLNRADVSNYSYPQVYNVYCVFRWTMFAASLHQETFVFRNGTIKGVYIRLREYENHTCLIFSSVFYRMQILCPRITQIDLGNDMFGSCLPKLFKIHMQQHYISFQILVSRQAGHSHVSQWQHRWAALSHI